jgi:hypothetical protein
MLEGLLIGWILSLFNFDNIFIDAVNQIFNTDFNTSVYWLTFAILGVISNIKFK